MDMEDGTHPESLNIPSSFGGHLPASGVRCSSEEEPTAGPKCGLCGVPGSPFRLLSGPGKGVLLGLTPAGTGQAKLPSGPVLVAFCLPSALGHT